MAVQPCTALTSATYFLACSSSSVASVTLLLLRAFPIDFLKTQTVNLPPGASASSLPLRSRGVLRAISGYWERVDVEAVEQGTALQAAWDALAELCACHVVTIDQLVRLVDDLLAMFPVVVVRIFLALTALW